MSGTDEPGRGGAPDREKLDDDDHDFLTFTEVGERLRLEVESAAEEATRLAESGSARDRERAETRLRDLIAAARRNATPPINDANFEKFFGYPGKARPAHASQEPETKQNT